MGYTRANAPGDDHAICALCQGKVASDRTEAQAEMVERRSREAVLACNRSFPKGFVFDGIDRSSFHRCEGFVDIKEAWAGDEPLHRYARIAKTHAPQDCIFEIIERREIDMAAFAFNDMIAAVAAQDMRDAESRARADDGDDAILRQGAIGSGNMGELILADLRDSMADSAEIIDKRPGIDVELFRDQRGADDPGIIGELQDLAIDGTGQGDGCRTRELKAQCVRESLPGKLETGMFGRLQRDRIA